MKDTDKWHRMEAIIKTNKIMVTDQMDRTIMEDMVKKMDLEKIMVYKKKKIIIILLFQICNNIVNFFRKGKIAKRKPTLPENDGEFHATHSYNGNNAFFRPNERFQ
jgi:hypothetical protein